VASIDLTPFGFTPTESLAYGALTAHGPLGGYALARVLSIARANAYQALHGLAAKGAAAPTGERPERFRPIQTSALFALLAEREGRKLDRLEAQLARPMPANLPSVVPITGERALIDLCLRTAARAAGAVTCLAPASFLARLTPAWHKRAADHAATSLWCLGDPPTADLPVELAGRAEPATADRYFAAPVVALDATETALIALVQAPGVLGYWASDRVVVGVVRASLRALTA
jgi:sugar-specific transcriptional regulator TrmB